MSVVAHGDLEQPGVSCGRPATSAACPSSPGCAVQPAANAGDRTLTPERLPALPPARSFNRWDHASFEERFWGKVLVRDAESCWEWLATKTRGYGRITVDRRAQQACRWAWMLVNGPLPDEFQIDHLCRNRGCVNPRHLQPVTRRENILRGVSPTAQNARKTHCANGHEFTPENSYRSSRGRRVCRVCRRVRNRNYKSQVRPRRLPSKSDAAARTIGG